MNSSDGVSLAVFRVIFSSTLGVQCILNLQSPEIFHNGMIPIEITEGFSPLWSLRVSNLSDMFGVAPARMAIFLISGLFLLSIAIAVGFFVCPAAILALVIQVVLKNSSNSSAYGAYEFATIGLFYCSILPVSGCLALKVVKGSEKLYIIATWTLRAHMSVVYFAAGVEKAVGNQWWNGEALWRAMARPSALGEGVYFMYHLDIILTLLGICAVLVQLCYPVLAFFKKTRKILFVLIESFHLVIAVSMGLWIFSAFMASMNVGALWSFQSKTKRLSSGKLASGTEVST